MMGLYKLWLSGAIDGCSRPKVKASKWRFDEWNHTTTSRL